MIDMSQVSDTMSDTVECVYVAYLEGSDATHRHTETRSGVSRHGERGRARASGASRGTEPRCPGRSDAAPTLAAADPADLDVDLDVTLDRCPRCGRTEELRRVGPEMLCGVCAALDDDDEIGREELRRRLPWHAQCAAARARVAASKRAIESRFTDAEEGRAPSTAAKSAVTIRDFGRRLPADALLPRRGEGVVATPSFACSSGPVPGGRFSSGRGAS